MTEDKPYTLDGVPITADELMDRADNEGCEWQVEGLRRTSEAAAFFRHHGQEVGVVAAKGLVG